MAEQDNQVFPTTPQLLEIWRRTEIPTVLYARICSLVCAGMLYVGKCVLKQYAAL